MKHYIIEYLEKKNGNVEMKEKFTTTKRDLLNDFDYKYIHKKELELGYKNNSICSICNIREV